MSLPNRLEEPRLLGILVLELLVRWHTCLSALTDCSSVAVGGILVFWNRRKGGDDQEGK